MKNAEFHMRIIKIMKIIEFDSRITKKWNLRTSCENQENLKTHRISVEKQEIHENHIIPTANNKIMKNLKFK